MWALNRQNGLGAVETQKQVLELPCFSDRETDSRCYMVMFVGGKRGG